MRERKRVRIRSNDWVKSIPIDEVHPDPNNPRHSDPARMQLLRLSLSKLGFVLPIVATPQGLILSGHQRHTVAKELGFSTVPVQFLDVSEDDVRGINVMFNRSTNDFNPMDTGNKSSSTLSLEDLIESANQFEDISDESWFAIDCKLEDIKGYAATVADKYNKKSVVTVNNLVAKGVKIPIVLSESGRVVNGAHRLFAAREKGISNWPVIRIPDEYADLADSFLNYLSMDYQVGGDFERLLRYSAYRRPQNNRGHVPKAYRFWANGNRTLLDRDSYSTDYWRTFRNVHGRSLLDFGSGLCKVAPFLNTKGFDCVDFEPYRINPDNGNGIPDPAFSIRKAREFLDCVKSGRKFDSIFLASVLNSIPFPRDRMCVLSIVHSLCSHSTKVYGTCRDISDFHYEYSGIRNASYFVFDSEPGVRLGDAISNPKIQKFHTQEELRSIVSHFWSSCETWPGGNVFYFKLAAPKRVSWKVLEEALRFEFDLPYADGTSMGLSDYAVDAFRERLGNSLTTKVS